METGPSSPSASSSSSSSASPGPGAGETAITSGNLLRSRWASILSEPLRPVYYRDRTKSKLRSFLYIAVLGFIVSLFIVILSIRLSSPSVSISTVNTMSFTQFNNTKANHPDLSCHCSNNNLATAKLLNPVMLDLAGNITLNKQIECLSPNFTSNLANVFNSVRNQVTNYDPRILTDPDVERALQVYLPVVYQDTCVELWSSAQSLIAYVKPSATFVLTDTEYVDSAVTQMNSWFEQFKGEYIRTLRSSLSLSRASFVDYLAMSQGANPNQMLNFTVFNQGMIKILSSPYILQLVFQVVSNFTDTTRDQASPLVKLIASSSYENYFNSCQVNQCTFLTPEPWYRTLLDTMGGVSACYAVFRLLARWIYEIRAHDSWSPPIERQLQQLRSKELNNTNSANGRNSLFVGHTASQTSAATPTRTIRNSGLLKARSSQLEMAMGGLTVQESPESHQREIDLKIV